MNKETSSLATIEQVNAVSIYEDGKMSDLLTAIEKEVKTFIPVVDTAKGRKDIASLAHKVARSKTFLDDLGKDLIEESKKKVNAVNSERKTMRDRLDDLKATARKPLTDWEDAEKERAEKVSASIENLSSFYMEDDYIRSTIPSGEMQESLKTLKAIKIDGSFGDRAAEAAQIKDEQVQKLELIIETKIISENEQAELEKLRKEKEEREEEDRLEKIRMEGEERAKQKLLDDARIEKERVEEERKELQQKHDDEIKRQKRLKDDAIEAIRLEQEQKETKRIADEQAIKDKEEKKKQEEQAEIDRLEKKEKARKANIEHQRKINKNIVSALAELGINAKDSEKIIIEIVNGHIPNVTINY